jgi:hypothetical protein
VISDDFLNQRPHQRPRAYSILPTQLKIAVSSLCLTGAAGVCGVPMFQEVVRNSICTKSDVQTTATKAGPRKKQETIVDRMRMYLPEADPRLEGFINSTMSLFTREQIRKSSRVLDLLAGAYQSSSSLTSAHCPGQGGKTSKQVSTIG